MANFSLISVIVPVYNVEQYLERCIESIQQQSHSNIEIVIINDGSTDSSGTIASELARSDNRIRVFSDENRGLSAARNKGISEANGEYICFVDSDDLIHIDYLKILLDQMLRNNAEVVQCDFMKFGDTDIIDPRSTILESSVQSKVLTREEYLRSIYEPINIPKYIICCNKLFKSSLFLEKKVLFKEGILHEDEEILFKIILSTETLVDIQEPLYYYYQRSNSIMNTKTLKSYVDYVNILLSRLLVIKNFQLGDDLAQKTQKVLAEQIYVGLAICSKDKFLRNQLAENFILFVTNPQINIKKKAIIILFRLSPSFFGSLYNKFVLQN